MTFIPIPAEGDLKVWWVPQIPGKAFEVLVGSLEQGGQILDLLANYDLFQFENRIKPDYSNTGGVQRYESGEWVEVDDEELP